ncbi:hypothetical protein HU200_034724 [Digitaria exilis]|uniref:PGG domain-containing protein n=1 Tax=Digitaria exilis TaxID=1010633 RepID=A0A835ELV7_9POAL|nr:hypothetical protein HU200_034724 [Digitaria exilis]CAB3489607.1 unnamed protein product [Digitaria exilis]
MDTDRRMDPALYKAATQGKVELLMRLVDPRDRSVLGSTTPQLNTALHLAALHGHLDFAGEVLYMKKELLVSQNGDGDTPLHLAAKAGGVEMAKLLLMHAVGWPHDRESPLIVANKAGNNALHEAVWNHNADVAVALLDADPSRAYDLNKRMETPLHTAAREGLVHVVAAIVENPWEPEDPCVSIIGTPLHQATLGASLTIVETLLKKRPELTDQTDSEGNNALHYAAQKDHERVVELLLNNTTKLAYNANREGMSPLHVAVHYGSTNAIKVMLRHCPDVAEMVDGHGRNAFHASVISGKANVLQCLLRHARPGELLNRTDTSGDTPLHLAAKRSRVECALLLLDDRRVDICVRDCDGHTARSLVEMKLHSGETDTYEMHLLKKLQQQECKRCRKHQLPPVSSGGRRGLNDKDFDSVVDAYFLAATLIATVTFAATFTMPGGYDQTQGIPLHGRSAAFKVFVLSNTVAMCISIVVIFLLIWARQESVQLRLHNLMWSQRLTIIACLTLLLSLMTAVYVTIAPIAPWLAYTVIAIGTSTPALFFFISWLGG